MDRQAPKLPSNRSLQACQASLRPARGGFTLPELLVVIAVIAIVLAIGLPAFSKISLEARTGAATQQLNGLVARAQVIASANKAVMAVRFLPVEWDSGKGDLQQRQGAQKAVLFRYSFTAIDPNDPADPNSVVYSERFQRVESGPEVTLPTEMWAAPIEALVDGPSNKPNDVPFNAPEHILNGRLARGDPSKVFSTSWDPDDSSLKGYQKDFLDADDFAIVFDAGGLRRAPSFTKDAVSMKLWVQDPTKINANNNEPPYIEIRRRQFTGIVLYEREAFEAQGAFGESAAKARQGLLLRSGTPYFVDRSGGGLISGIPQAGVGSKN